MPRPTSEKFHPYQTDYISQELRGIDVTPRPWSINNIVLKYSRNQENLLDTGCGTAYKTIPLHKEFTQTYGLDPSTDMLKKAQEAIRKKNITNFTLIKGVSDTLPFLEKQFDVVTAILTFTCPKEFKRVLKNDGIYIGEYLGANDKTELTQYFGKDEHGWRGANLNHTNQTLKDKLEHEIGLYFNDIKIINGSWKTKYSTEGLWKLLNNTYRTVRNFSEKKDRAAFDHAISELSNNNEVLLQQDRILVIASTTSNLLIDRS